MVGSDTSWASCYNNSILGKPILDKLASMGLSRHDPGSFYKLWEDFTVRVSTIVMDIYNSRASISHDKVDTSHDKVEPLQKLHIWGGAGSDSTGVTYNLMNRPNLTEVLPPELFTIQVWDSSTESVSKSLIEKGYQLVLSNTDYVYLDCGNSGWVRPGGYWCQPYHEWFHIYEYVDDIVEKWGLTEDQVSQIIGSEVRSSTSVTTIFELTSFHLVLLVNLLDPSLGGND